LEFSNKTANLSGSSIRDTFKALANNKIISFAGGMPSSAFYPADEFASIAQNILNTNPAKALNYGITEGYAPLIEKIRNRATEQNILDNTSENQDSPQILVTSGGQQAINLTAMILLNEGDGVVVENPSFLGALNAFRSFGANLYGVPMQNAGMDIEALEKTLTTNKNIKFIYVIPTFQNPMGVTTSLQKRKQIIDLAYKFNVYILEDNPYGDLKFNPSTPSLPTIMQLEREAQNRGNVIYTGSFSKILSPGLRVGYAIAPREIIDKMTVCKQVQDVHTPLIPQMIVNDYIENFDLNKHISKCNAHYSKQCSHMLNCIDRLFPKNSGIKATKPDGGLFLWCYGGKKDSATLAKEALDLGVCIVSGNGFLPNSTDSTSSFRLNFSASPLDKIEEGIGILSKIVG
jgi:2-aminoadipate transaminase